jgi:hypothetical protein
LSAAGDDEEAINRKQGSTIECGKTVPEGERRLLLAIGRSARRAERSSLVESVLGQSLAPVGLDLLELTEYAWHDCYGEITPPDEVILNILICSEGNLATMIRAASLAVRDSRDLQLWAEHILAKDGAQS